MFMASLEKFIKSGSLIALLRLLLVLLRLLLSLLRLLLSLLRLLLVLLRLLACPSVFFGTLLSG